MLLQLNVRYKTRVAPKLTGIRRDPRAKAAPTDVADNGAAHGKAVPVDAGETG